MRYENAGCRELTFFAGETEQDGFCIYNYKEWYPTVPFPACKELWIRFKVTHEKNSSRRWAVGSVGDRCWCAIWSDNGALIIDNGEVRTKRVEIYLESNKAYNILLHMKAGELQEFFVQETGQSYRYEGNVANGKPLEGLFFYADNTTTLLSDIVVSTEEISFDDHAKKLDWLWKQPALSSKGTIGVSEFAVDASARVENPSDAVNKNVKNYANRINVGEFYDIFIKEGVQVEEIHLFSSGYLPMAGKVLLSDNGTDWTECGSWQSEDGKYATAKVQANKAYCYYRLLPTENACISGNADFSNINIVARRSDAVQGKEEVNTDIRTVVTADASVNADACRTAERNQTVSLRSVRQVEALDVAQADVARAVSCEGRLFAETDMTRNIEVMGSCETSLYTETHVMGLTNVPTCRKLFRKFFGGTDLLRETTAVCLMEVDLERKARESDTTCFVEIDITRKIRNGGAIFPTFVEADLARKACRLEVLQMDILRRIPWETSIKAKRPIQGNPFILPAENQRPAPVSMMITLGEHSISDSFTMQTVQDADLLDVVQGEIINFPYRYCVRRVSQRDMLKTLEGMYDCYDLLYRKNYITLKSVTRYEKDEAGTMVGYSRALTSKEQMEELASKLGLEAVLAYDEFESTSKNFDNQSYAGIISTLFGWTSQLPRLQINVFLRKGKLYAVQRGHEFGTVDVSGLPHSRPSVTRETLFDLGFDYEYITTTTITEEQMEHWKKDDDKDFFTGTVSDETGTYTYDKGLLKEETHESEESKTSVIYSYETDDNGNIRMVAKQEIGEDGGEKKTSYDYKAPSYILAKTKDSTGNVSTSLSQGQNGVTEFARKEDYRARAGIVEEIKFTGGEWKTAVQNSFPVNDWATITKIIREARWLLGKTHEEVTLDVWNCPQVIDFTHKVRLQGAEYFLVSNTIVQTLKETKQTLRLARWY